MTTLHLHRAALAKNALRSVKRENEEIVDASATTADAQTTETVLIPTGTDPAPDAVAAVVDPAAATTAAVAIEGDEPDTPVEDPEAVPASDPPAAETPVVTEPETTDVATGTTEETPVVDAGTTSEEEPVANTSTEPEFDGNEVDPDLISEMQEEAVNDATDNAEERVEEVLGEGNDGAATVAALEALYEQVEHAIARGDITPSYNAMVASQIRHQGIRVGVESMTLSMESAGDPVESAKLALENISDLISRVMQSLRTNFKRVTQAFADSNKTFEEMCNVHEERLAKERSAIVKPTKVKSNEMIPLATAGLDRHFVTAEGVQREYLKAITADLKISNFILLDFAKTLSTRATQFREAITQLDLTKPETLKQFNRRLEAIKPIEKLFRAEFLDKAMWFGPTSYRLSSRMGKSSWNQRTEDQLKIEMDGMVIDLAELALEGVVLGEDRYRSNTGDKIISGLKGAAVLAGAGVGAAVGFAAGGGATAGVGAVAGAGVGALAGSYAGKTVGGAGDIAANTARDLANGTLTEFKVADIEAVVRLSEDYIANCRSAAKIYGEMEQEWQRIWDALERLCDRTSRNYEDIQYKDRTISSFINGLYDVGYSLLLAQYYAASGTEYKRSLRCVRYNTYLINAMNRAVQKAEASVA